ncbi:NAD-dependent epimerase/dehydratase family protein [Streptomyces sp. NPDC048057]|uniref:NAD-dependent epimerase/dehydratase family protein n=1 Tax=Streptomyces sp. NPDC048057 TaxID=3155628 RepID=UPI0033ECE7F8
MRLLILGGTEFVGRAFVGSALARGWDVTVFNRGTRPAPEGVTALVGDRTAADGLAALASAPDGWDVVVDTWADAPVAVRDAARLLAERAGRYAYVSSCSVYAWPAPPGSDETAPLVEGAPDARDVPYAEAKRGGELAAVDAFGAERSLLVRAGLLLGPFENVGRLPWWLARIARGGQVTAPGPADASVQYVDARDLAEWTLSAAQAGLSGPYNLVGPPGAATFGEVLDACVAATGSGAELRWVAPERVLEAGIEPWTDLPLWVPPQASDLVGALYSLDVGRARATGLECRPLAETVVDTWEWLRTVGGEVRGERGTGLPAEKEEVWRGL